MKFFILNVCAIVICLFLLSCEGWDKTWHLDAEWSEEMCYQNIEKRKKQIDKIAVLRSSKRNIYTILSTFMKQRPVIVSDQRKIDWLIDSISFHSEVHNFSCPTTDHKYSPFHIVAFDSSTLRAAYIILYQCDDGKHSAVWNYSNAGIYWIKTPSMLNEENRLINGVDRGDLLKINSVLVNHVAD